jgi:hypothetical protein
MRDSMQATKVFVSADKHSFSERDATRLLLTASNRSSLRLTPLHYAFFRNAIFSTGPFTCLVLHSISLITSPGRRH